MKRYSVVVWVGLVAACGATAVAGCGDDDVAEPTPAPSAEDAGGDASRTFPGKDAAGTDSQVNASDTGVGDATNDSAPEAGQDAGSDADAGSNADAGADAGADADTGAPKDAGNDADADAGATATCAASIANGPVGSVFPLGANVAGASASDSHCGGNATVTANGGNDADGRYSLTTSGDTDGHIVLTGLTFHRTLSGEINHLAFAGGAQAIPIQAAGSGGPGTAYDATKAHIALSIGTVKNGCTKGGNTISFVSGHPEAVIKYVDNAGNDVGATTGTDGLVWISGLTPGGKTQVSMTPSVAGCFFTYALYTGQLALETDSVTTISVTLQK